MNSLSGEVTMSNCFCLPSHNGSTLKGKHLLPRDSGIFVLLIRTATLENAHDMCAQRRLRSACPSAQFDQSLRCPHEETLHPWLSKMRQVKILNRLHECAG